MSSLKNKPILVTGASGFIGNRLVERLYLHEGADVRPFVHQFRHASRLARFPIRMSAGSVGDAAAVRKAVEGCEAVVHCAIGTGGSPDENRQVTVEGTRNVCEAAKAAGARLIYFSTFSVYGVTAPGKLKEDAPKTATDPYGGSKLEAERVVQQYQQSGLAATILQPTIVYGPWAYWTTHIAQQLSQGTVALPDGGRGLCNAVYIDDVVQAVLLSLRRETAAPGPFLISGAEPVTWRDYYLLHGSAIPDSGVGDLSAEELAGLLNTAPPPVGLITPKMKFHFKAFVAEFPHTRKTVQRIKKKIRGNVIAPPPPPPAVDDGPRRFTGHYPDHLPLLRSQTAVDVSRARAELGYNPEFPASRGQEIVAEWLRWAGFAASR